MTSLRELLEEYDAARQALAEAQDRVGLAREAILGGEPAAPPKPPPAPKRRAPSSDVTPRPKPVQKVAPAEKPAAGALGETRTDRIVTMIGASPQRRWTVAEVADAIGVENRQVVGVALVALFNQGRLARPEKGLYQALP